MKIKFEWEPIKCWGAKEIGTGGLACRAKVPGGWIVNNYTWQNTGCSESSVFIPDAEHLWEIETE